MGQRSGWGQIGTYLFELWAQPGGPSGRLATTAGSGPISILSLPQGVRPRSPAWFWKCSSHLVPCPVSSSRSHLPVVGKPWRGRDGGAAVGVFGNHTGYDANGNMTARPASGGGSNAFTFDVDNRLLTAAVAGGTEEYNYLADNKRVWKKEPSGTEYVYFYGVGGQKLATYQVVSSPFSLTQVSLNVYFGGKLIRADGVAVASDRLGSVTGRSAAADSPSVTSHDYYPYGAEIGGATSGNRDKFGTYHRDASTALDYADQRYYAPGNGRFLTADPYEASGGAGEPGSWNRYPYVGGDPVNFGDPSGLASCPAGSQTCVDVVAQTTGVPYFVSIPGVCVIDGQMVLDSFLCSFPTLPYDWRSSDVQHDLLIKNAEVAAQGLRTMVDIRDDFRRAVQNGALSSSCIRELGRITLLPLPGEDTGPGVTAQQIAAALTSVALIPAETSSMVAEFNANPNLTAEALPTQNAIVFRASAVQRRIWEQNFGLLIHEMLHLVTGYGDEAIQSMLGLTVGAARVNISDHFTTYCGIGTRSRL